jgi:hypothetical protein
MSEELTDAKAQQAAIEEVREDIEREQFETRQRLARERLFQFATGGIALFGLLLVLLWLWAGATARVVVLPYEFQFLVSTEFAVFAAYLLFVGLILVVLFSVRIYLLQRRSERRVFDLNQNLRRMQQVRASSPPPPVPAAARRPAEPAPTSVAQKPPPDFPRIPEIPDELVAACATGDGVLYAGLGVSASAGFPTWQQILATIVERADAESTWQLTTPDQTNLGPEQLSRALRTSVQAGDLSGVPDLLITRLGRTTLLSYVRELFSGPQVPPSRLYSALGSIPFASVLVGSWDDLFERTFAEDIQPGDSAIFSIVSSTDFGDRFRQNRFTIVKLNGALANEHDLIFTRDEFSRALQENPDLAKFLSSLCTSRSLFFVGASLESISSFLLSVGVASPSNRRHYALVSWQPDIELQRERFRSRWGVDLLVYIADPEHGAASEFCEQLAQRVKAARATAAASAPRSPLRPATLDRVVLYNIGPFEELSLDFHPGWNVILGDNGSGKSTVLRAIALALCGDDFRAAALAAPLLRSADGVSSGFIELAVGDRTYRTELARSGDTVRVRSRQLTPAQEGTWPVLGFPPMRGATARNPRGPSAEDEPPYPVLADILPSLAGGVDFRLDDLKQWVVNVFSRPMSTDAASGDGTAAVDPHIQVDRMFEIITRLTPGLKVSSPKLTSSFDVLVDTDDGIIPIGQLSQGMSSIVGWIGTLLRRMYAMYATPPEAQPALVLVDEVDAHLHPAWQRQLVPTIREVFPSLQIIATTHSPLLLPSLTPAEIIRLRRNPETRRIEAPITSYDVEDYNADQILVSPLFDLPSTLSPQREQDVADYTRLVAQQSRGELSESDTRRLRQVALRLDLVTPTEQTHSTARLAYAIIQEGFERHAASLPKEDRDKVDDEIRVQLVEMLSGTRRPG